MAVSTIADFVEGSNNLKATVIMAVAVEMDKRTTTVVRLSVKAPIAQWIRALLSDGRGRRFESCWGAFHSFLL